MASEAEKSSSPDGELIAAIRQCSSPLAPVPTALPVRLSPVQDVRAVLFDVYGTLFVSASGDIGVASAGSDAEAFVAACAWAMNERVSQAVGEVACQWLHKAILADHARLKATGTAYPEVDIRECWQVVCQRLVDDRRLSRPPSPDEIQRLALRYELAVNPVWPMPGARRLLAGLAARGVSLGIVSNAQFHTRLLFDALLDAAPERLGFSPNLCLWSYVVRHGKPSPRLFELAQRQLATQGVAPDQIVFVGNDMLNDIAPPASLDWKTILFAGDRRSLRLRQDEPRCSGITPDAVVDQLPQILDLVATTG